MEIEFPRIQLIWFSQITSTQHRPKSCSDRDSNPRLFGSKPTSKQPSRWFTDPCHRILLEKFFQPLVQPPGIEAGSPDYMSSVLTTTLWLRSGGSRTHIHCGGSSPVKSIATPVAISGLQYRLQAHRAGFRVTDQIHDS